MMPSLRFNLYISPDEYLRWYKSEAKDVVTKSLDGRTVRFPADVLRPYVSHQGINGCFEIEFSKAGKFQSITKLF